MGDRDNRNSNRFEIAKLVLDKLVLALIIAGAGFFFNFLLQQEKTQGDYQKQIFDRRIQAYVTILEEAKQARDELAILYGARGDSTETLGELGRKVELGELSSRWSDFQSGFKHSGGRGAVSYAPVLESLANIERVARENDLYISQHIRDRVHEFLDIVISDLSASLEKLVGTPGQSFYFETDSEVESFRQSAWKRAEEAYQLLREEIRNSLHIEGIPLG